MIFTVTVKSQQKRVARVDACERVLLLLADSTEAPEKNMLHRDASYNNRMNGTCFRCESCAIDEIPTTPEVPHSGGGGCGLISGSYSCGCSTGYPAPTPTLGSGFWVGLQQTSFYTNVPSGGWVVAVACGSGTIVGSFPTTGSSYGYGAGSILGVSVMIYPAGVVYGAGYVPANETTFPILALTPTEGNAIVSSGFNITTGAISCPENQPDFFCPIGDSFGYVGNIVPCLTKFGGESGCPLFDEFRANADDVIAGKRYGFNMGGTSFGGGELITGVVQFTNADGNQYCGAVNEGDRVPTDALSGLCGLLMWPDTVTEFFEEGCAECVADAAETNPIPCQYLNNLTNGAFNTDYGGYNSAGDLGFFGIGPSDPPIIAEGTTAENTGFWEQFWGWDPLTGTTTLTPDGSLGVLPPISTLITGCSCGNTTGSSQDFYTFVEKFECCPADAKNPEQRQSAKIEGYTVVKTVWAGLACGSCLGSLAAACSCPARNASESGSLRGSPGIYGYVPCNLCPCEGQAASQDPNTSSGIWWYDGGMQPAEDPANPVDSGAGICAQQCSDVIANTTQCSSPCSQLTESGLGGRGTQLNLENFENCTGLSPQEFLDDPCSRSFFFPASLSACDLLYTPPAVDTKKPFVFLEHVTVLEGCDTCQPGGTASFNCAGLCHPEDEGCYLNHTNGPISNASAICSGISLGELTNKIIPTTETIKVLDCDGNTVSTEKLKFVRVWNQLCEGSGEDPCGCCSTSVGLAGPIGELSGAVLCGGGCGGCCSGAGCFDTLGGCSVPIIPGSKCGNTGGGGGSGGGGGAGGGSG